MQVQPRRRRLFASDRANGSLSRVTIGGTASSKVSLNCHSSSASSLYVGATGGGLSPITITDNNNRPSLAVMDAGQDNNGSMASASAGPVVDGEQHDKELLELLQLLEGSTPVIPDALLDYYMARAGVECDDVRLKRLVGLIGQKFITDVANDAMHHFRLRTGGMGASAGAGTGAGSRVGGTTGLSASSSVSTSAANKKNTLTLEDLASALAEYGINIKRPAYYT